MISIQNLHLQYGEEVIFRDFNLEISKGENVVLLGPSGTGKSSILHVLLGFVKPQKGMIKVDGQILSPSTIHKIRRKTAWLPQELGLQMETVRELLIEPFSLAANKKQEPCQTEIEEALAALDLDLTMINKKTNEISGGQKQRILLASCILMRKQILLLDEPSSALDAESVESLAKLIRSQKGLTILSSSHDQKWIQHCDRVVEICK